MIKRYKEPIFLLNFKLIGSKQCLTGLFLSIFFLLIFSFNSIAQVCGTSGLDGPQNAVPPVNTYYPLAANVSLAAGSKSINLSSVPGNDPNFNLSYGVAPIRSGDLILIIQMQDATANFTNSNIYGSGLANSGFDFLGGTGYTDLGNSGKFEYVVATSDVNLTGGLLEFRGAGVGGGAVNTYTNSDATATRGQRRFQVVRVPQYSTLVLNANITTPPYNGNVGGIIAFDVAGTMNFNGFYVDASERGFRGGYGPISGSGTNTSTEYAVLSSSTRSVGKGEGIVGTPRYMWDGFKQVDNTAEGLPSGSYGRGAPGNAGGGGNDHNAGGGGGANAGRGGIGGRGWQGGLGDVNPLTGGGRPGSAIPFDLSRLIMGGGGGGGDANDATTGVKGGVGGGIILINVEKIDGAGLIRANGGAGQAGVFNANSDGAGGGGAGGSIFVRAQSPSPTATLTLQANGGNGGNTQDTGNDPPHGPGGGGGGGFIYSQVPSATINTSIIAGISGRTSYGVGIPHGATDGSTGSAISFTTTDLPLHIRGGGSLCYPSLTTTLTELNAGPAGIRNPGSTATYKLRVTNDIGGGNAGGVSVDFLLPFGFSVSGVTAFLSGDVAGPSAPTFTVGATGKITFSTYNISPGDYVEFTISVNISNNIPGGIYQASAQASYLDPTRTNANPVRIITASVNPFFGANTTYETGGSTNVPGENYNGDLSSSVVEDVYINAPLLSSDCSGITNGNFNVATVGEFSAPNYIGGWKAANPTDKVKIVSSISDNTNNVAFIKEGFSLQQTILSIEPSTTYSLNFTYIKNNVCVNTSSASKFKIEIVDANTLAVINNTNLANAGTSPRNASISFTTGVNTSSIIIRISDDNSPNNSCAVLIDDITIISPLDFNITETDVSCFGASDGSFSIVGLSGGSAPYTISYSSNGGATYSNITNSGVIPQVSGFYTVTGLPAGAYKIRILDANGCGDPAKDITINQPAVLELSGTNTAILCNAGTSNVTLTQSGGTAPYQYSINNGVTFQTQNIFPNLVAGSYNFLVKDANNCTDIFNISFTEPSLLSVTNSVIPIKCFGGTASLNLTGSGGTGAYQYSLDGLTYQSVNSFSNLIAGSYNYFVRDGNGCIKSSSVVITQPAVVGLSLANTSISCFGGFSTVTLTGSGGSRTYQYSLDGSTFQSSNSFANILAGTYTFTVKDANNCTDTESITITQPTALTLSATSTAILCNGGISTVTLSGTGGTGIYQYSKDGTTYQSSNAFANILAGANTFYVKDANNCVSTTSITINQPSVLDLSISNSAILCAGGTSTVTLTGNGGTSTYTYSLNAGVYQSSNSFSNLVAGTYTFNIKDANNCVASKSVTIVEPSALAISESHIDVSCFGDSSGSISVNVSGGVGPYNVTWSNGATSLNQTNFPAGAYTVTITDANNCQVTQTITLSQPLNISISASRLNVKCFGEATGSINVTVSGGTAPFTYAWSNGATTEDVSGLIAGNYSLEVTDSKGCLSFANVTITQPASPISITETHINNTCFDESQGSINLTVSGGVGPYIYSWSNGATIEDINSLAPGNYTVTVTDANSCTATQTITITPLAPFVISNTQVNLLCNGAATGEINLNLFGGTLPYVISWNNGATTSSLQNLSAGTYTYTARDNNGCEITNSIIITEPALLTLSGINTAILCNGDLSTVTLTSAGGTGAYQYSKDGTTFQSSNVFANLAAGSYTFSVRDENNCIKTFPINITQPALLTLSGINTAILCNGDLSTVTLTSAGGTGAYQYSKDGTTFQSSNVFSNLAAGNYTFSVRDENNCIKTFPINITQPALLTLSGINTAILCNGDLSTVTLTSAGGTGAYQYSKDGTTFQSSNVFVNLAAGSYTFSVRDENNCIKTFPINITQPALLTLSGINTAILCNGDLSTVTLTSAGGTGAYQYSKDGTTFQSSNVFANLAAGSYTFSVRDENNCIKTFPINITQPALLTLSGTNTAILCNGDLSTVTLTSDGGTVAYQYSKDGTTFQSSNVFANLAAGSYTFSVRDENNCIKTFPINITQPALLTLSGINTAILCNGDLSTVTLTSAGGTGAYQYSKDGTTFQSSNVFSNLAAGNYTFSVRDENNCIKTFPINITQPALLTLSGINTAILCNGDLSTVTLTSAGGTGAYQYSKDGTTFQSSNVFANLTAGSYTFSVKDVNNCVKTFSIGIDQPIKLLSESTKQNVLCFGEATGSINFSVSGGIAPYTYSWSNGATTKVITNLIAGNYTLTITDANQCKLTQSVTITQPVAPLNFTEIHQNVLCFGDATGSINITATGGTAPYSYSWSNGSSNKDLSGLSAGNYTLTITDANNCSITQTIQITQPLEAISLSETHQNVSCFGGADGVINITTIGGTAPYKYKWSNGAITKDLTGLTIGNYTLTVTDANNCIKTISVTISQPAAPLKITETHQNILCFGDAKGIINVDITGGTAPYTYLWSNGATTKDLINITAGIYSVVVTDAKGCTVGMPIQITQPAAPLQITENHQNVKCFGDETGSININVLGGTAPYTYLWNNGLGLQNVSGIKAGTYQVTVTDKNGCTLTKQIEITQPAASLTLSETHVNNVCFGDKIGSINVTVNGGTAPYTYKWNSGQTTKNLSNLAQGLYELTVTDANKCIQKISVTINPLEPFVVKESSQQVKCFNDNTGSINLVLSGGEAPYIVTWSNGETGSQLFNLKAGNYTYKATDAYGCVIQKTVTVTQPEPLTATFKVTNTTCKFSVDGAVFLNIKGGKAPYRYTWNGLDRGPTASLSSITSGKYVIIVTDANSCSIFVEAEVLQGNCAPNADNDRYTTNEDTPITIKTPGIILNDTDPDQDDIKIMLNTVRDPGETQGTVTGNNAEIKTVNGGVIINNSGSFTYTPRKNFFGTERFVYKVSDGFLSSNTATVTIVVLAVNDPPVAIDDNYTTLEDVPLDGTVIPNDSDPDGDVLTYRLLAQPNNAVVSFNANGTFRFVPVLNFSGTVTFDYQVCDPGGLCDTATVTVIVTPVNDPPNAVDDLFKTQINLPFNARVGDNDSDPENDPLQFSALTQPTNGTLTFNINGTFIYTPNNGFKGVDTFRYRTCDPFGLCDEAVVTILIQPIVTVNLTPGFGTVKEGNKISITAVLTESLFEDVTVTLAYGGTAVNGNDYSLSGNFVTITIPAGSTTTTQELTINAINDALRDDGEHAIVNISATSTVYALIGTGSVIDITDVYPDSRPYLPEENPDINPDPLVSPNRDGAGNDKFIIYNITKYPNNEVLIFNRWGNEVYKIEGYNNNDKAFEGIANVGILTNTNKELVDGVYFYVIYTTDTNGAKKINRGYLILKR